MRRDGTMNDAPLMNIVQPVTQLAEYTANVRVRQPLHLSQSRVTVSNKSVFSFLRRLITWHCPHLLLCTVLQRTCCSAPGSSQSISPARQATAANPRQWSKKGSPYSITERRIPEMIPVLGSQPAGDVNHKPGGRLPLLSARPAVTPATLKRAATNFVAW